MCILLTPDRSVYSVDAVDTRRSFMQTPDVPPIQYPNTCSSVQYPPATWRHTFSTNVTTLPKATSAMPSMYIHISYQAPIHQKKAVAHAAAQSCHAKKIGIQCVWYRIHGFSFRLQYVTTTSILLSHASQKTRFVTLRHAFTPCHEKKRP